MTMLADIKVETYKSVVQLSGFLDSQTGIDRRSRARVTSVKNDMQTNSMKPGQISFFSSGSATLHANAPKALPVPPPADTARNAEQRWDGEGGNLPARSD